MKEGSTLGRRLKVILVYAMALLASEASGWETRGDVPKIAGPWWQIAGNPSIGELGSPGQEPVDFGIWPAADGTWQLWSCIRKTQEEGHGRLFYRWEGSELTAANWKPMGIAMRGETDFGERPGGLQAPFVVRQERNFFMFYGDWESICLATSQDGKRFQRASIGDRGPQLFSEGSGKRTRDPMLIRFGDRWLCYYSAMEGEGGIFARESGRLRDWSGSTPRQVCGGGSPGNRWWNAECPHVVFHGGSFYLFRTSRYKGQPLTTVYCSTDPLDFGVGDDAKIVAALPVAAPEICRFRGRTYIAALNPDLDGIRVARLEFVPDP